MFSPTHAHKQAIALAHGVLLNQRRASGLVLLIGEAFPLAFQSFQQTRAAFGVVLAQLLQVGVDLAPHIDKNLHNAPLVTLPVSNDGDVMSLAHGKVRDPQRDRLRTADARAQQQQDHGVVALAREGVGRNAIKESLCLLIGQRQVRRLIFAAESAHGAGGVFLELLALDRFI